MNIDLPARRMGKSRFVFESAVAMAEQGKRVVIVGKDRSKTADRVEDFMGHNVFPETLIIKGAGDK